MSTNSSSGGAAPESPSPILTSKTQASANPKSRGSAHCRASGAGRWLIATLATILLCINQQFALRFFIGYTQLNTEYFYLLIALMLPFTFLIFPAIVERAARSHSLVRPGAVRHHLRLLDLPDDLHPRRGSRTAGNSAARRPGVYRRRPHHVGGADGGAAPHRRLESAAQRLPVHRLSAVRR